MRKIFPIGDSYAQRAMPMRMDSVRKLLSGLIADRGLNLSDVSKKLGKNHAYMQQFIKRGIPEKLPEDIRSKLAEMFGIDEHLLGAPLRRAQSQSIQAVVANPPYLKEYAVKGGGAYGGGMLDDGDWQQGGEPTQEVIAQWALPPSYVRNELNLSFDTADIISVRGDSMDDGSKFGLSSGDRVIVDRADRDPSQGAIFAVWDGSGVIVKQIEPVRGSDPLRIICKSLNPRYEPFELILDENTHIIGRIAAKFSRM